MNESNNTESLFDEFPPISTEEWEKVIKEDLKGANYKKKLRWDSGEGVNPLPFYRREDMEQIDRSAAIAKAYSDSEPNAWEIREPIWNHDIAEAQDSIQNALNCGADALQLHVHIRRTEGALGGDLQGVPLQNQQQFSKLLQNVSFDETPIHFDAGLATPAYLAMFWNEAKVRESDSGKLKGTFSYDPFVNLLQHGRYPRKKDQLEKDIYHLAEFSSKNLPDFRPLCMDARVYHNAGATLVQELGLALAAASEYLSILTEQGFSADDAARKLFFSFSVGSKYFLEIAKFRAARLLWKNLLKGYRANTDIEAYIHAETSEWNKTLYDPYTNMLRTSTESMCAAIAGCDSITVQPFDEHFRQPDDFSQRIARNQQLILSEEANFGKVEDPAAGSYYIEELTNEIGEKAWNYFQEIETEGGLFKAIENGTVQTALHESQEKRDEAVATRKHIFVGTNQYSNADETMAGELDDKFQTVSLNETDYEVDVDPDQPIKSIAKAFKDGAEMGDIAPSLFNFGRQKFRTVNPYRGAHAFEELRLATEKHETTPLVLLLPLGNKRWRKARATFSSNFFGCAGYDIEEPIGFENTDEALEAIENLEPDIIVLCSSDKEYEDLVPDISNKLGDSELQPSIVVAGNPKDNLDNFKDAGVDEFIYSGCNILAILKRFQEKLGILSSQN